jgi:acyl-CoA reductase-like NAD-dependent aldehyde dehydrogenase
MNKHPHLINGEWVPGASYAHNQNPSNLNETIGEYAQADVAQVESAISAAKHAFSTWANTGIQARCDILDRIGTEILLRKEELGTLLSREEGKTRAEGIGEAARAGYIFKFFAGECLRMGGEVLPSVRPGIGVEVTREPLGVIGLITPWNFPLAIPAWKIAPALAYGNCVVFKPAELVPGSAWVLADIVRRSGVTPGAFNLVMGQGSVVGQSLVDHPDVNAISFTGSQAVGHRLAKACGANLKKLQLEMGGKNAQVVLDDADLKTAVEVCVQSAFFSTGQRCTAASRLIVTEGIYRAFVKAMHERMSNLKVGDALAVDTDIGPVASRAQLEQDLSYIALGRAEGATLELGGEQPSLPQSGHYLMPALFSNTTPEMRINREEIFGPVASMVCVSGYEEALSVANDTPFGLVAGIATTSLKHATHFKRNAQVGMVMVNLPTAGVDYHVPFGGRKASSYGSREQGRYAAEFYTTLKTAYTMA